MIHDFATFPRERDRHFVLEHNINRNRYPQKKTILFILCLLVSSVLFAQVLLTRSGSPVTGSGIAGLETFYALQSRADHKINEVADQPLNNEGARADFEKMLNEPQSEPSLGFGFYDSLQASDWHVPVQKGVYVTEEDRTRAGYRYMLQAASVKNRREAVNLSSRLKAMGMPASYSLSRTNSGREWYRVNVGPFSNVSIMNKAEDVLVSMRMMPLKRRIP